MSHEQEHVNTGGGAYFHGSVTAGRDVIGGDKVVLGNEGVSGVELASCFSPYTHGSARRQPHAELTQPG